jgi:apolipoprotein N-acyltransferase
VDLKLKSWWRVVAAAMLSGVAFFFASGLHPLWFLTWLAPLPVLLIAPRVTRTQLVIAALLGYCAGSLNMWSYYKLVVPFPVSLLILVTPGIMLAVSVLPFRSFVLRGQGLRAALVTPAMWVAIEYLSEFRSPHSTFGNLGYTQMDCLPVLQIVSLTGIWSLSFLLVLVPAAVAVLCVRQMGLRSKLRTGIVTFALIAAALGFGFYRLRTEQAGPHLNVALLDNDATRFATGQASVDLMRAYVAHVPELAARGAQAVVMPEKLARFDAATMAETDAVMEKAAQQNHVDLIFGVERVEAGQTLHFNESRFYSRNGVMTASYEKHHMLPVFEGNLVVGTKRVLVPEAGATAGLTICKDMDFPKLSREYGNDGAGVLLIPAWDFDADGWLHGRMAIMRGVESGFSEARAAKQGRLTLSDDRGRVLAEVVTSAAGFVSIVGSVPAGHDATLYGRAGNWFAWMDLLLVALLLGWLWRPYKALRTS